ncbi:MAG: hypothetical protein Kow0089_17470 [Desulfobulbaceae bacterium]
MEITVEQECPQCGAPVTLSEDDRLLTCDFCGVRNYLQTATTFRYVLPDRLEPEERRHLVYAPYIRLKSNLFQVTELGISHRVVDTTQLGFVMPGLPPSLGLRPQAMKAIRVTEKTPGRFLRLSVQARTILDKAVQLSKLSGEVGNHLLHRVYIGDQVSLVYLPLHRDDTSLCDAVTDNPLIELDRITKYSLVGTTFNPRWQISFLPTLCPRCGWDLEGDTDCLAPTCSNCETAWELTGNGLRRVPWEVQPGDTTTPLHLPFWKVRTVIPALEIGSFADFIERANLPMVPRREWRDQPMEFWIPAFKIRPHTFLAIARQVTISNWRLSLEPGRKTSGLYSANLPSTEARQAIKIVLAACAASPPRIFPFLPETRPREITATLVHLPCRDRGHDWVQPQTGTAIPKSVLRFGRSL